MGGDAQPQNRVQPLSYEELMAMVDAQNLAANDHTYDSLAYGSDDDVSVAFYEPCDLDEQSFNEIKKNNKYYNDPNSSMEELNFRETYIGPEGGVILGRTLRDNTSLKVLNLHNTVLEGWHPFFNLLENTPLARYATLVLGEMASATKILGRRCK